MLKQNLHQLQIAVWIFCRICCKVNQCIRSGWNNFEWVQSQTTP